MNIIAVIFGVYLIVISLILNTKTTKDKFILKVIPFFASCYIVIYAFYNMGFIIINF